MHYNDVVDRSVFCASWSVYQLSSQLYRLQFRSLDPAEVMCDNTSTDIVQCLYLLAYRNIFPIFDLYELYLGSYKIHIVQSKIKFKLYNYARNREKYTCSFLFVAVKGSDVTASL